MRSLPLSSPGRRGVSSRRSGTSRAMARPPLAIRISLPPATSSMSRDRCVFAS